MCTSLPATRWAAVCTGLAQLGGCTASHAPHVGPPSHPPNHTHTPVLLTLVQRACPAPRPRPHPQETKALFLQAQAAWGLGQLGRAAELTAEVLRRDPAHGLAADLAAELRAAGQAVPGPEA